MRSPRAQVRKRAADTASRGRRLAEKAVLLRDGAVTAASAGDAASAARLQRDRAVVQQALTAVLRRVRPPANTDG
jgi:hypothetical protein